MGRDEDRVAAFERRFREAVVEDLLRRAGYADGPIARGATRTLAPEVEARGAEAIEGGLSWQEAMRRFQEELLRRTLSECDWSIVDAARRLGVARSHVYGLIRAFGLERPRPRRRR